MRSYGGWNKRRLRMNNELLVFFHLVVVVGLIVGAKVYGKEALGLLFSLFLVISNIFVTKEMEFCSLVITTCDVYTVGSILSLNLIQEIYGKKESRKYLWKGLFGLIVFLFMSFFQNSYLPTPHSLPTHNAFSLILSHTPRIVIASLVVTFVSDRIDMKIFQKVKHALPDLPFVSRFISSTLISQLIDTVLFSFLGLYGVVENIWHCIGVAYVVKALLILGSALYFFFTKKEFYKPSEAKL